MDFGDELYRLNPKDSDFARTEMFDERRIYQYRRIG